MEKANKKALADREKRTNCQKYVRLVLDSNLAATAMIQDLLAKRAELLVEVRALPARCIIWERSVGQHTIVPNQSTGMNLELDEQWQLEKDVVRLLTVPELVQAVRHKTLEEVVNELRAAFPENRYTLFILGERKELAGHSRALTELRVLQKINVLQVTPNARALLEELQRFTKAIAEAPYKQKEAALLSGFSKYLGNDNKQCVKVEGTNGFGRLWQQHLNRLPLVTLEVAETIISEYSCPKKLLDEYANNPTAVETMAELKIRRGGGGAVALQSDRRLGNVLSEKLYTLYNTRDPDALL